jgi:hypothetical protein
MGGASSAIGTVFRKVANVGKEVRGEKLIPDPEKKQEETKQAEAKEESETKRLLRVKRKGRSATVLSSSSGVADEASVSKKTLLGS